MTSAEFNKFRSEITELMLEAVEASGRAFPIILTINDKGKKGMIEIPPEIMSIGPIKQMYFRAVKESLKHMNIVAMCFASEAYMLQVDEENKLTDEVREHGISEHPNRVEVVNLQFQTKTELHITSFRIERKESTEEGEEGDIATLIPYFDKGGDSMKDSEGMLANFLN